MKRAYAYLSWAFISIWLLFTALFSVALNDDLYDLFQRLSDVNEQTCGLTEVERQALNRETAMYLAGRADDMPSLSERALAHMSDVRSLFKTARIVMYISLAVSACFGVLAFQYSMSSVWRAYFVVAAAFIALLAALGVMAALDFNNMFSAFHRLLFSNNLWVIDPRTDAIIRILPEKFFALAAATIAISAVVRLLLVGALVKLIQRLIRRLNA